MNLDNQQTKQCIAQDITFERDLLVFYSLVSFQSMNADIPSPIDLRNAEDAKEWEESAMVKRPWRIDFFQAFEREIHHAAGSHQLRILELGSGPGFLAAHLVRSLSPELYVALDFSEAMHALAKARLGASAVNVQFVERSFRESNWSEGLGKFNHVVTHQAVHELRHKRHATALHSQVRQQLETGGSYLVCDHYCGVGGMANEQLYMSIPEQVEALKNSGFDSVVQVLEMKGLVLLRAN